jgi:Uma2 family endonuclease
MYEKKDVYERTGVKELWLVDPATKTATGYFLSGNSYEEFYKKTGSLGSRLLDIIINF